MLVARQQPRHTIIGLTFPSKPDDHHDQRNMEAAFLSPAASNNVQTTSASLMTLLIGWLAPRQHRYAQRPSSWLSLRDGGAVARERPRLATGAVRHPTSARTEVLTFGLRPSKQPPMPRLQGPQVFAAPGRHGEPLPAARPSASHCFPRGPLIAVRTIAVRLAGRERWRRRSPSAR